MNEAETRAELIDPALAQAGWGVIEGAIIRREFPITQGRIQGGGRRGAALSADYVLIYKNTKLAVVEAKKRDLPMTEGVAQAKDYAERLHIRYTYSTNGVGIYQIDMETGKEAEIEAFPSPEELWQKTFAEENDWRDRFAAIPFEDKSGTWQARYYQDNAISKTLDAIAANKDRILLTLATGTGKTFIAFQLAWKLFQSRWSLSREPTRRPRILFLADRNILADQAFNSFSSFAEDALVRIAPNEVKKKGRVPKNGSIFFTIFQTFMSGKDENGKSAPYFGEYPKDFFDFIIIDECHRGGANDESSWRDILEYFSPAVQLGLTATPKRKGNVDSYKYFGEPVYQYSLKEGINDGFLTPFKVRQIDTTLDDYVYTDDDEVLEGEVVEGRRYTEEEFNTVIEIQEREKYRVKVFMDEINQNEKGIVFCATQLHALAVRDLINQMKTSKEPNYCVRVTADDGKLGEEALRKFQDNEKTIPTILTTSKKLSTGVDARNVRNIILLRPVKDMIEFKQIVGRGTRMFDGKDYFTIYDFVKAHHHFSDPEWDGEPLVCDVCENVPCTCGVTPPGDCKVCGQRPCVCPPKPCKKCGQAPCVCEPEPCEKCGQLPCVCKKKLKIKLADGKERQIQHMASTSFWSADGKPISVAEFLENLFGTLPEFFKNENELRAIWGKPESRKRLLEQLSEKGYDTGQLKEISELIAAEKSDLFDVLAYISFALAPITREERASSHKQQILSLYNEKQQVFIDFVLSQYIAEGVDELSPDKLPDLLNIKYNGLEGAKQELGEIKSIREVFIGFQEHLYEVA